MVGTSITMTDAEAAAVVQDREVSDEATVASEDSTEPYFHVQTGKIYMAREAWRILADEGIPGYREKLSSRSNHRSANATAGDVRVVDIPFRPPISDIDDAPTSQTPTHSCPVSPAISETSIRNVPSFGPTQSSIDAALHPNSPNPLSPQKPVHQPIASDIELLEDEEEDPVVLRAKAMALAAANGQKLTPAQIQLIAQPDVQVI